MRISDWSSDVCSSDLYRKEANLVFNRYFDLSPEDEPGLPLLPLFLSMRAAVLTHVLALQAQGAGNKELAAQAQAYLRLAYDLLEPVEPRLVALCRLSGSGTSDERRGGKEWDSRW